MKTYRGTSSAAGSWRSPLCLSPVAHHPAQTLYDTFAGGKHSVFHMVGNVEQESNPDLWMEPMLLSLRRIRRWRIPANWSVADWLDEMRSVVTLAAIEAVRCFDAARGLALDAFIRSRVLARALTFYRQEWKYAARHVDGVSLPEDQERLLPEQCLVAPETGPPADREILSEALALLSERGRWVIEELYLHESTVADVAHHLGISQRAVNKRKLAALRRLRRHLGALGLNQT